MIHCSAHCRACDCHFTSTAAFDKHRRDGQCHDPATRKSLRVRTTDGRCDLQRPVPDGPVTIYWDVIE